jgi:hypothetical protein
MAGRAGVLEAGGGDGGQPEQGGGERARVQLPLTLAARDVAVVESLDGRGGHIDVADRIGGGLGKEFGARAIVLRIGHTHSNDGDAAH